VNGSQREEDKENLTGGSFELCVAFELAHLLCPFPPRHTLFSPVFAAALMPTHF